MKRKFIVIASLILIVAGSSNIQINKAELRVIKSSKKLIVLNKGAKAKIKFKGKVKWKTQNRKVATVSSKGIIKAKRQGKTKIIAQNREIKKIYNIKVVNRKIKNKNTSEKIMKTISPSIENTDVEYTQKPDKTPLVPQPTKEPIIPNESENPNTDSPHTTEEPQPTTPVVYDVWLLFGIDQEIFTPQTTLITGNVSFENYESTIKIIVNNKPVLEQKLNKGESTFSIAVDFSEYKNGEKIVISREYTGNDMNDSSVAIWNQVKNFTIS